MDVMGTCGLVVLPLVFAVIFASTSAQLLTLLGNNIILYKHGEVNAEYQQLLPKQ
jgi:Na+/H+ antiporter NhaD/arsenite permease-like protein